MILECKLDEFDIKAACREYIEHNLHKLPLKAGMLVFDHSTTPPTVSFVVEVQQEKRGETAHE